MQVHDERKARVRRPGRQHRTALRVAVAVVLAVTIGLGVTAADSKPSAAHTAPGVNACTYSPDKVWGVYDFKHACNHHDICYRNRWGRSYCDNTFWNEMIRSCQSRYAWYNPQRQWCYQAAGVYWVAVASFGGFRY